MTASEVVEYLLSPGQLLAQLYGLLQAGGWLGPMTALIIERATIANCHDKWHPTDVCLLSRQTFAWWARHTGCERSVCAIVIGRASRAAVNGRLSVGRVDDGVHVWRVR